MNPRCHLCLVSDQPTPNITPVLDRSFRPEQVILLTSPEKQQQAERLRQVIQPAGVGVALWPIDDAMDVEHIRDRVFELLEKHGDCIALNATGGTKPMSIAAYEVFRGFDLPIFYVHPAQDRVVWMHPADRQPFDIEDRIHLPQFLQAHGVQSQPMHRMSMPGHLRELTQTLISGIDRYMPALGTLNYMAFQARLSLRAELPKDKMSWKALADLIDLFAAEGLLVSDQNHVHFRDEDARFFVNGGWLEHHVFSVIDHMRRHNPQIHDLAQGVNVARGEVCNELDVVFLCDNRLYLIECKTKQFKQGGSDVVYKLDALTGTLGGLRASSMLVSFRKLGKADINRAAEARIKVCAGRDIRDLGERIRRWIRHQRQL